MTEPTRAGTQAGRLVRLTEIQSDGGFAWIGRPLVDSPVASARLFEDGLELGPSNSIHRDIREQGCGRYCWYEGYLRFAASDNSDPRRNGKDYWALVSPTTSCALASSLEAAALWPSDTPITARHGLLKEIVKVIYPQFCLSDAGRKLDEDTSFHAVIRRFFGDIAPDIITDRRYGLRELTKLALSVGGDVAECGCYNGVTAYLMADVIRAAGSDKELHLFDSFSGLSRPQQDDGQHWHEGDLAFPLESVRKNLADFDFVRYHPGWIPQAFPQVADRRFSLVHIDVDLYDPTRDSLTFFWERLVPGGLIVCDDYGISTCPGATKAIDAFFADKAEPIINLATGGAFILKRT